MSKSNKLKQLLEQKAKIEEQLRAEKEKQYLLIGKIAVKYDLHTWDKEEIENLFKVAVKNGASFYASSNQQVENNQQQESQDSESSSYDHNGVYKNQ